MGSDGGLLDRLDSEHALIVAAQAMWQLSAIEQMARSATFVAEWGTLPRHVAAKGKANSRLPSWSQTVTAQTTVGC